MQRVEDSKKLELFYSFAFFSHRISQRCVQLQQNVSVLSVRSFGFKRNFYR